MVGGWGWGLACGRTVPSMTHVISRQHGSQVNTHVMTASSDLENTGCFESKPTISRLRFKSVCRLFGVRFCFSVVLLRPSKRVPQTVVLIAPLPVAAASYRSFNHARCIVGATYSIVKQTTNKLHYTTKSSIYYRIFSNPIRTNFCRFLKRKKVSSRFQSAPFLQPPLAYKAD